MAIHDEDCRKHAIHYGTPEEIAAMHAWHRAHPDVLVSVSETYVGVQITEVVNGKTVTRTGTRSTTKMVPLREWCPCFKVAPPSLP